MKCVLILVLMDNTLGEAIIKIEFIEYKVLILVLMDNTLGEKIYDTSTRIHNLS